jgi:capsular polysaccharide biosynthesis protein
VAGGQAVRLVHRRGRARIKRKMTRTSIVLLSEARGEFLMVERVRAGLAGQGIGSRHITALSSDLSAEESGTEGLEVLDRQPDYLDAMQLGSAQLVDDVDREQSALGINLRRLWQADFRSWREAYPDDEMARIAVGYLRALRRILEEKRPLALWGEDGGHLCKQLAYLLCKPLAVNHWFHWAAPLPGRIVLYDNLLATNDRTSFERFEPVPEEVSYAEEFLEALRASRIQYAIPRDMTMGSARIANFGRLLTRRYVTRPPGAESLYPFRFAQLYGRQRLNAARIRSAYRPIGDERFVFYPMHAGRDTQISVRAHQWQNQLALIEHMAASMPYGCELAIKEHPFEVGAFPANVLKSLLRRHSNIRLLDPSTHAHAVFPRCTAVATINSTAGFEGIFFGKPVVTFGHSSFRGLGLTYDVTDMFETPNVFVQALGRGAPPEAEIVRFVCFLYRNSMPGVGLSLDLSDENIQHYVEHLARRVQLAAVSSPVAT